MIMAGFYALRMCAHAQIYLVHPWSMSCQSFFEIKPKNKPGASLRFYFRDSASLRFLLNAQIRYPQRIGIPAPARYATAIFHQSKGGYSQTTSCGIFAGYGIFAGCGKIAGKNLQDEILKQDGIPRDPTKSCLSILLHPVHKLFCFVSLAVILLEAEGKSIFR